MNPRQPSLDELFARYLQRQSVQERGHEAEEAPGEVVPFEAIPVRQIDAGQAWEEARIALGPLGLDQAGLPQAPPPGWKVLAACAGQETALPLCLGNFAQMVRDLAALLRFPRQFPAAPEDSPVADLPGLESWARALSREGSLGGVLLSTGVLRLARRFDLAQEILEAGKPSGPENAWRAWNNEAASLAWHRGRHDLADEMWRAQEKYLPCQFNLGMADLFRNNLSQARKRLSRAASGLPEDSAWYHLCRLYLALAESPAIRQT